MLTSLPGRLLAASLVGLTAAGIVLGIAAALDGAFFQPKQTMAVVPCYFTTPDPLATANDQPGVPTTATGCSPEPEADNGVVGFFTRLMGQSASGPSAPMIEPPPARSSP